MDDRFLFLGVMEDQFLLSAFILAGLVLFGVAGFYLTGLLRQIRGELRQIRDELSRTGLLRQILREIRDELHELRKQDVASVRDDEPRNEKKASVTPIQERRKRKKA